eukprot:196220-Pelagomonas_calceolata.AAC.1
MMTFMTASCFTPFCCIQDNSCSACTRAQGGKEKGGVLKWSMLLLPRPVLLHPQQQLQRLHMVEGGAHIKGRFRNGQDRPWTPFAGACTSAAHSEQLLCLHRIAWNQPRKHGAYDFR